MEHRCQCCGTVNTRSKCSYCGFTEIIDMDRDGTSTVTHLAAVHKHFLRKRIRDISVVTYPYQWNPETSSLEAKKEELVWLADGKDCLGTHWTEATFGQLTPGKEITLKFSYKLEGGSKQNYTCEAKITPVACDDFWKIALWIGPNLRMHVDLGAPTRYASAEWIPLDLK